MQENTKRADVLPIRPDEDPVARILVENPIGTIWRISHLISCYADPFYAEIDRRFRISRLELVSLHCLANARELKAQQLVEMLVRPKNTVSVAVHSLVRKGLIWRTPDPTDARQALLSLTKDGRTLYDAILPRMIEREERLLEPLTEAERERFEDLLEKLVRHIPTWRFTKLP